MLGMPITSEQSSELSSIINLLTEREIRTSFIALGDKTVVCLLVEKDGWETLGKAHTRDPDKFEYNLGKLVSLKDAVSNLGSGRFWEQVEKIPKQSKDEVIVEIIEDLERLNG
jgi:hypothetical protein